MIIGGSAQIVKIQIKRPKLFSFLTRFIEMPFLFFQKFSISIEEK